MYYGYGNKHCIYKISPPQASGAVDGVSFRIWVVDVAAKPASKAAKPAGAKKPLSGYMRFAQERRSYAASTSASASADRHACGRRSRRQPRARRSRASVG